MNYIDVLDKLYYEKKNPVYGFLHSLKYDLTTLRNIKDKEIIIIGTGINGHLCYEQLKKQGVTISGFVENYKPLRGETLKGKNISSPYDAFKNTDAIFIIAIDKKYFHDARRELKANNISRYSTFFTRNISDFGHNATLFEIYKKTINNVLTANIETQKSVIGALSQMPGQPLGIIEHPLLDGTGWWAPSLSYMFNELNQMTDIANILEIGAGLGGFSCAMKQINKNFNLDWVSLNNQEESSSFNFIKETYPGYDYNNYFGIIEDPKFKIADKSDYYDYIVMTEVLEHFVTNPVKVLAKIAGMLKKDGKFIISTPNGGNLYYYETWKQLKEFEDFANNTQYYENHFGHNYQYSKEEMLEIFSLSELEVIQYSLSDSNRHNFVVVRK